MSVPKGHVLVIDDEKGLREMLHYALTERGYDVATAENGRAAVEQARSRTFDLALCDIMMPIMGGMETLRALKRDHPAMEVIMVTGFATQETAAESLKLGAFDYIAKPYDLDTLCELVDKAMARRQTDGSADAR